MDQKKIAPSKSKSKRATDAGLAMGAVDRLGEREEAADLALKDAIGCAEWATRVAVFNPSQDVAPLGVEPHLLEASQVVLAHVECVLKQMGTGAACVELCRNEHSPLSTLDEADCVRRIVSFTKVVFVDAAARETGAAKVIRDGIARVSKQLQEGADDGLQ